ncbi:MAG: ABC transporter ATP-binding protein [Brevinema sp.]
MPNIIEAKNIHLTYKIAQSFSLKRLFTRTELDKNILTVHALKGVSFNLKRSKNLGIVGTNGSGKSTLLRVLSQTFLPDEGNLKINTQDVQLLTLGSGFINELTGRDNLYLNALLLGISKETLNSGLADEIIDFSELGEFINFPMYSYSSGMRSRLTFSVAACIQPELLLLDEVFSVGDAHFRAKSQKRIEEMIDSDKSVVMISHDTGAIEKHCEQALWLHQGETKMFGEAKEVMKAYIDFTK